MSRLSTSELYFHIKSRLAKANCRQDRACKRLPVLPQLEYLNALSTRASIESSACQGGRSLPFHD